MLSTASFNLFFQLLPWSVLEHAKLPGNNILKSQKLLTSFHVILFLSRYVEPFRLMQKLLWQKMEHAVIVQNLNPEEHPHHGLPLLKAFHFIASTESSIILDGAKNLVGSHTGEIDVVDFFKLSREGYSTLCDRHPRMQTQQTIFKTAQSPL